MVPSRTEPWTWKLPKTTPLTDLFLRLSTIEFKILVQRGENLELRLTMVTEPVLDGPFWMSHTYIQVQIHMVNFSGTKHLNNWWTDSDESCESSLDRWWWFHTGVKSMWHFFFFCYTPYFASKVDHQKARTHAQSSKDLLDRFHFQLNLFWAVNQKKIQLFFPAFYIYTHTHINNPMM